MASSSSHHRRTYSTLPLHPIISTDGSSIITRPSSRLGTRIKDNEANDLVLLDALDLRLPITHTVNELQALLDGSLTDALHKLNEFRQEVGLGEPQHASSISSSDEDQDDRDGGADGDGDGDGDEEDDTALDSDSDTLGSPTITPADFDARHRAKRDAEMLEAFIQEACCVLSSIREDVQSMIPTPSSFSSSAAATFRSHFPNAAALDPRTVVESLSHSYHRANELLQHISLYTPALSSLDPPSSPTPNIPASLADSSHISSTLSAARASLAGAAKRRFSVPASPVSPSFAASSSSASPAPASSLAHSPDLSPPSRPPGLPRSFSSASFSPPSPSVHPYGHSSYSYSLPTPPLSAIRAFLAEESAKLATRLPPPPLTIPPIFEEWSQNLSHALHDAKDYVHDEGEKLREFVADEAEKLRTALKHGADRLLHYHELPHEWKNNKYILSGYRFIPIDRPGQLLLSSIQWHNETVNSESMSSHVWRLSGFSSLTLGSARPRSLHTLHTRMLHHLLHCIHLPHHTPRQSGAERPLR